MDDNIFDVSVTILTHPARTRRDPPAKGREFDLMGRMEVGDQGMGFEASCSTNNQTATNEVIRVPSRVHVPGRGRASPTSARCRDPQHLPQYTPASRTC